MEKKKGGGGGEAIKLKWTSVSKAHRHTWHRLNGFDAFMSRRSEEADLAPFLLFAPEIINNDVVNSILFLFTHY